GLDENGGGHIPGVVVIGGRGVPGVVVIPAVGNGHPHRRGGIPGVAAAGGGAVLGIVPAAAAGGGGRPVPGVIPLGRCAGAIPGVIAAGHRCVAGVVPQGDRGDEGAVAAAVGAPFVAVGGDIEIPQVAPGDHSDGFVLLRAVPQGLLQLGDLAVELGGGGDLVLHRHARHQAYLPALVLQLVEGRLQQLPVAGIGGVPGGHHQQVEVLHEGVGQLRVGAAIALEAADLEDLLDAALEGKAVVGVHH